MTGKETSLVVRSIEWVDEGVDAGAVSAVGDGSGAALVVGDTSFGEVGAVDVEPEVTVGGVVGVDEGVEVGVDRGVNVVVVNGGSLGDGGSLHRGSLHRGSSSDRGGNRGRSSLLGTEGSRVEAVGTLGDVIAFNAESVLAGGPLDVVGLTAVSNVAVLTGPLAELVDGLLPGDGAVLLGVCGAELSGTGVVPLLLEDLCAGGVNELTSGGRGQAGCKHLIKNIYNLYNLLIWLFCSIIRRAWGKVKNLEKKMPHAQRGEHLKVLSRV